jgi:hypothetical protein
MRMGTVSAVLFLFFALFQFAKCQVWQDSTINTIKIKTSNDLKEIPKIPFDKAGNKETDTTQKSLTTTFTDTTKQSKGIDTTVTYYAKDSVVFRFKDKSLRLRGGSQVKFKTQELDAEIIELFFGNSIMKATGVQDSLGKQTGSPKFTDKGETYYGKAINYNFDSQQGTITFGETEISTGYYFGERIKRISETELFVKDGCYTTCDKPHPHYYFGSPEMKVVANDRVFLDPIYFYVEDMPVFMVPFGLFFPNKTGRQSGLVVPTFFFSKSRGVVLENLGIYLALSDYYDTEMLMNFYSKGGFILKDLWRWNLLNNFNGNLDFEYGRTRANVDQNFTTDWKLIFNHTHTLTPQSNIVANINMTSQGYYVNTSTNLQDRITQSLTSNASYNRTFDNGTGYSVSYGRQDNIIDNTYTQNSQIRYSVPQLFPVKKVLKDQNWIPDWLKETAFTYSVYGYWEQDRNNSYKPFIRNDSTFYDTTSYLLIRRRISHSPSISVSPKLGYFTLTPSINLSANNYFRRLTRTYNAADSSTIDHYQSGLFTEYTYNMGVNVSTRLFGIVKPKLFGIDAIRHTFQPSVAFVYTPDLSGDKYGFYGKYYNSTTGQNVRYSRYETDGGGIASTQMQESINYSFLNSIEAKIAQQDTMPDKNVEWLRFNISGGYNFKADSLKFSDISMDFRTPAIGNISFGGTTSFTLYDEAPVYNQQTGQFTNAFTKVNRFLVKEGKGLARMTSFTLQLSTSFSSSGSQGNGTFSKDTTSQKKDSIGIGERFQQRINYHESENDIFGDKTSGWSPLSIPWSVNLGLNFNYSQPFIHQVTRSVNMSAGFNMNLTPTWSVQANAMYDFVALQLLTPTIAIHKDLHCWQLDFTWYPIGFNRGFNLRFGIKAPQLQDLKMEKKSSLLY